MEIGTEISKKIRAAIKGKLQELGAYVDEELPDYIMVMVANKKNAQQMADDLSLFLGNNTIKFTVWLHGVLEKLRSTAVEPASLRPKLLPSDPSTSSRDEHKGEEPRALSVSSSRSDRLEGRVSSSAHEHHGRRTSSDRSSSRLTSTVKPLLEHSAEAVIDIKPDLEDDDLITNDPRVVPSGKPRPLVSRSSNRGSGRTEESYRSSEVMRGQERSSSIYGRSYREGHSKDEFSRKRKAPVASSVVRIQKGHGRLYESEEDEEDEEDYGMPSRVSLPPKPERKPSLPPAKQANKNLILKAISEAQDSISKTTAVYTIPQRQTVPVAPRTRSASDEMSRAAIRLVQEHLHELLPQEAHHTRPNVPSRSLASRLQQDLPDDENREQQFELQLLETSRLKTLDTRSFIMRKPELEQNPPIRNRLDTVNQEEATPTTPRTVQAREKPECSPKFIVTLDGVPSPLASLTEHDMDTDHAPSSMTVDPSADHRTKPVQISMTSDLLFDDEGMMIEGEEQMEEETAKVKRQKVLERCRFWPACKSGDECVYHHPKTQCRTFPSCVYGEKCLFIHPNCKYDGKCSKPDCPYTHTSHRALLQPPKPAPPPQSSSVCRFFPECKRTDCTFYHPKPCRFAAHCNRTGCPFYHPPASVPPRHALKWTKAQAS
ncbi:zinc finger CCCH domain-containing protein 14 isoform X2 [Ictalurus furcatus]|uniref:zinc finger CCCH domain-containing protein 14 isoform X2 n=1 Tax=Ictalurus furcatus TaxID=66913 RepID=UPI0023506B98|nr:zinc finger CCCH domain-containing protein 14 isoform X2 [Ictalurus furcatus]